MYNETAKFIKKRFFCKKIQQILMNTNLFSSCQNPLGRWYWLQVLKVCYQEFDQNSFFWLAAECAIKLQPAGGGAGHVNECVPGLRHAWNLLKCITEYIANNCIYISATGGVNATQMSKNNGSFLAWCGLIQECPVVESSVDEHTNNESCSSLHVKLWTCHHKHALAKLGSVLMRYYAIVDMSKIPLYMVSGGSYRVISEDSYTQRFFDILFNRTDLTVGLLVTVKDAERDSNICGYMLFYVEFVQVDDRTEAQLFAVCLTPVPHWRELEGLQKDHADRGCTESGNARQVLQEICNEVDVLVKQEDTEQLVSRPTSEVEPTSIDPKAASAKPSKESVLDKIKRRETCVTPFALAAQKSFVASGKENIYVKPRLERRGSARDTSVIAKRSLSRESSVASDSMSEVEKRNTAVIQRIILSELRLRGVSREHHEYKHLYHHTYKAICFALRAKLSYGSGIHLEETQDKVDRLITMFLEP